MCSVGNCMKIFGGEPHLKHHYKTAHPDAIFEIDFLSKETIVKEQEKTEKYMKIKKKQTKDEVEFAKGRFVLKNTLFKGKSDDDSQELQVGKTELKLSAIDLWNFARSDYK